MCAKSNCETHFSKKIISLLRKQRVVETDSLQKVFNGRSRRSIFRDLASFKYFSSMTHTGRYITLPEIPQFDLNGLWFFRSIGFSIDGASIKVAIHRIIGESDAGLTHKELKKIFRVRIHNALIELVRTKKIGRVVSEDAERYLYISIDVITAKKQQERRRALHQQIVVEHALSPLVIIQVLVEIIRSGKIRAEAVDIFQRLHATGVVITKAQVNYVFARYGIGVKKTQIST